MEPIKKYDQTAIDEKLKRAIKYGMLNKKLKAGQEKK